MPSALAMGTAGATGDDSVSLTYAGMPAIERIVTGAAKAIRNIEDVVRASLAVQTSPAGAAQPLADAGGDGRAAWRNVFAGEFINVRAQPNTSSAVVVTLPTGAVITADAEHGGWLRMVEDRTQRVPAGSWALIHHPVHGALLERCCEGDMPQ